MYPLFRYVGPPAIAVDAERSSGGIALRRRDDLVAAARALGIARADVVTYVVDAVGTLRVADRGSEHVACARGGPVLAAGELEIDAQARRIVTATNLSTGFCPDTTCFRALADALARAAIPGPAAFDPPFEMRRCVRCGARQVVKDEVYECAECGTDLPRRWNLDRARCERGWVVAGEVTWIVDVLVEPGDRNEDRARRCSAAGARRSLRSQRARSTRGSARATGCSRTRGRTRCAKSSGRRERTRRESSRTSRASPAERCRTTSRSCWCAECDRDPSRDCEYGSDCMPIRPTHPVRGGWSPRARGAEREAQSRRGAPRCQRRPCERAAGGLVRAPPATTPPRATPSAP